MKEKSEFEAPRVPKDVVDLRYKVNISFIRPSFEIIINNFFYKFVTSHVF